MWHFEGLFLEFCLLQYPSGLQRFICLPNAKYSHLFPRFSNFSSYIMASIPKSKISSKHHQLKNRKFHHLSQVQMSPEYNPLSTAPGHNCSPITDLRNWRNKFYALNTPHMQWWDRHRTITLWFNNYILGKVTSPELCLNPVEQTPLSFRPGNNLSWLLTLPSGQLDPPWVTHSSFFMKDDGTCL